jgi:hypothetical protein
MPPKGGKKKKSKKKPAAPQPRVEAPTCPVAGIAHVEVAKAVALSCGTPDARVHFTTDGSQPTADSKRFVRPFDVKAPGITVVRAVAVGVEGMLDSAVSDIEIVVEVDPWRRHRSPFGGKLSTVEEWEMITSGKTGRALLVSAEQVAEAAGSSVPGSSVSLVGGTALDTLVLGAAEAAMREAAAEAVAEAAATAMAAAAAEGAAAEGGDGSGGGVEETAAASCRVETSQGSHVTTVVASAQGAGAAPGPVSAAAGAPSFDPHAQPLCLSSIESVAITGCELGAFELASTSQLRSNLTSLNLTDNCLVDGSLVLGSPVCWLRKLALVANQFTAVPSLALAPKLLSLDLSFNPIKGFGTDAFSVTPLLVDLHLESCGLTSVQCSGTSPLAALKALKSLDLRSNQLGDLAELEQLFRSHLPQLAALDLSVNPCAESEEYRSWALRYANEHGPLRLLDGQLQHKEIATSGVSELQLHVDDPMVQDSASCSCLEGNPCAVKYNCKDWSRRFDIAKEVRKKKKLLLGF